MINVVKRVRQEMGWTQVQLAKRVGVSSNTIARWERYDPPAPKFVILLIPLVIPAHPRRTVCRRCGVPFDKNERRIMVPRPQGDGEYDLKDGIPVHTECYDAEVTDWPEWRA